MRGAWEVFYDPVGEDGLTRLQRESKKWDEEADAYIEKEERKLTERVSKADWDSSDPYNTFDGMEQSKSKTHAASKKPQAAVKSVKEREPSDAASRSAATALSTGPRSTHQRSASTATTRFAAPTAASQAKQATFAKHTSHDGSSISHNRTRSTIPMTSHTTIGRAKGRQVSAELRSGQPTMAQRTKPQMQPKKEAPKEDDGGSFVSFLQRQYAEEQEKHAGVQADLDDEEIANLEAALREEMQQELEANADFQLDMPEEPEPV